MLDTDLDYWAIRRALETGEGFEGTVEFFPEEGKYHLDGHRKCGVRMEPAETRRHGGRCPVCGKPPTVGVLHRVEELADRPPGARPAGAAGFRNLIQLPELVGEVLGVGPRSKAVTAVVDGLVDRLGPELEILERVPTDEIAKAGPPLVAEAIARVRRGAVIRDAGYDGEYGTIRVFTPDELRTTPATEVLFDLTPIPPTPPHPDPPPRPPTPAPEPPRPRPRRTPTRRCRGPRRGTLPQRRNGCRRLSTAPRPTPRPHPPTHTPPPPSPTPPPTHSLRPTPTAPPLWRTRRRAGDPGRARPRAAGRGRGGGGAVAGGGGAGDGEDADADPPAGLPGGRGGAGGRAVPGHHLHPAGLRRAPGAAGRPGARGCAADAGDDLPRAGAADPARAARGGGARARVPGRGRGRAAGAARRAAGLPRAGGPAAAARAGPAQAGPGRPLARPGRPRRPRSPGRWPATRRPCASATWSTWTTSWRCR